MSCLLSHGENKIKLKHWKYINAYEWKNKYYSKVIKLIKLFKVRDYWILSLSDNDFTCLQDFWISQPKEINTHGINQWE